MLFFPRLIFFFLLVAQQQGKKASSNVQTREFEPGKAEATRCNLHHKLIPLGLSQWQLLAAN